MVAPPDPETTELSQPDESVENAKSTAPLPDRPTSEYAFHRRVSTCAPNILEILTGAQIPGSAGESNSEWTDEMGEISFTHEEPWNKQFEVFLRDWKNQASASATAHRDAGYRCKHKYRLLGFIVLLWSAIVLIANGVMSCDERFIARFATICVNAIAIFLNGLFSGLNLGYVYRTHFEYERKFDDIAMDIDYMLIRDPQFRVPADAYMTEVKERMKKLAEAPELPKSRYFFC